MPGPARCPTSHPFLFWAREGSPTKIDYRKKDGTLVLTSLTGGPRMNGHHVSHLTHTHNTCHGHKYHIVRHLDKVVFEGGCSIRGIRKVTLPINTWNLTRKWSLQNEIGPKQDLCQFAC